MEDPTHFDPDHRHAPDLPDTEIPDALLPNVAVGRRRALGFLGAGAAAGVLAACGSGDGSTADGTNSSAASSTSSSSTSSAAATSAGVGDDACAVIPEETAGPYPGDGSNGPNVLDRDGVVRSDLTASFDGASGVAPGEPLRVELTVVDTAAGCVPYEGAAVYLWHCDREGRYSLYSAGVTEENYLRGVQVADGDGTLAFDTVFPGCYDGRWPHMHFAVYPSVADATAGRAKLATSQLALPEDVCAAVYGSVEGYERSVDNLSRVALDSDNVFRDGWSRELGTVTGGVGDGMVVRLTVAV